MNKGLDHKNNLSIVIIKSQPSGFDLTGQTYFNPMLIQNPLW